MDEKGIEQLARTLEKFIDREYIEKFFENDEGDLKRVVTISVRDIAKHLLICGYGKVDELQAEIANLTAMVDVLQSERDNLMRTVEESPAVIEEAKREKAKEILQELYNEAVSNVDELIDLTVYRIKSMAEREGIEVTNE